MSKLQHQQSVCSAAPCHRMHVQHDKLRHWSRRAICHVQALHGCLAGPSYPPGLGAESHYDTRINSRTSFDCVVTVARCHVTASALQDDYFIYMSDLLLSHINDDLVVRPALLHFPFLTIVSLVLSSSSVTIIKVPVNGTDMANV